MARFLHDCPALLFAYSDENNKNEPSLLSQTPFYTQNKNQVVMALGATPPAFFRHFLLYFLAFFLPHGLPVVFCLERPVFSRFSSEAPASHAVSNAHLRSKFAGSPTNYLTDSRPCGEHENLLE